MDSLFSAIRFVLLFIPLEIACKVFELLGVVYGLLEYPFQKGKRKAQRVYNKLENG